MILRGWRIDGFGRFHGAQVQDLSSGLTVIEGPNEAGKSTLLGFLRFMLFGFARGERKYPPLEGGRHGGRLYFSDHQGEWQLERFQGKQARLTAPDGRVLEEDALQSLLGRIDGAIFRDVFAFSLWELSNLEALSQEEVRDRLYSVGLTGAGKSASAARRTLEQRLGELMKPRAESARINQLLSALGEVRRRLREAQLQAQDYADLQRREEAAAAVYERLQQEAGGLRTRREFLLLLHSAEGTWNRLDRLETELGRAAGNLDAVLADELEDLLAAQKGRQSELEQRGRDERELTAQIAELTPPKELLEAAPAVAELVRGLGLHEDQLRRVEETLVAIEGKRVECAEIAARLRVAPDAEVVAWDFTVRQEIDGWAVRLRESEEKVRRLWEASERTSLEAARAAEDARAAEAALAPFEGVLDAASLDRRLAALESLQRMEEGAQRRRQRLLELGAVAAALAILGGIGLASGLLYMAAPLAAGLALAAWAGAAGSRARRQGSADARQAAQEGGLSWPLESADIERLRREAQAQRAGAAERDRLAQRALEAEEKRGLRAADAKEASRQLEAEQAQALMEEESFQEFKRRKGLPAGLAPALLASYATELAEFARVRAELDRLHREAADARARIGSWQAQAAEQLQRVGRAAPENPRELLGAVSALGAEVTKARTAMERVADLSAQRDGLRARLADVEERRREAEERVTEVLFAVGARDASEFAVLREASQVRAQFTDQAGAAADEVAKELRDGDPGARQAEMEAIAQRLERIDEVEQKEALTALLELRTLREQVAETADVAEYAAQEERLATELGRAVAQWRAVYSAKRLLERTLEVYERDRQPEVLRFASQGMARITGGRYVQVRQRTDEKGLVAVDAAGELRAPEELSRGTAEQLYLALRLGLAASYGERVAALPLVLDDVLVNFDPERARAVLSVLAEFAAAPGRQALLFTCHPFVREMAEEFPGVRTLHLPAPLAAGEAAAALAPDAAKDEELAQDLAQAILAAMGEREMAPRAIATAVGEPEARVRKELQTLLADGKVAAVGERRGRRYRAVRGAGLFEA